MKAVWKFPFEVDDRVQLLLPEASSVLHVGTDPAHPTISGRLALWALVDPTTPLVLPCPLRIIGTGHPLDGFAEHLGSVQDGPFMWHIFRGATR